MVEMTGLFDGSVAMGYCGSVLKSGALCSSGCFDLPRNIRKASAYSEFFSAE